MISQLEKHIAIAEDTEARLEEQIEEAKVILFGLRLDLSEVKEFIQDLKEMRG